MSKRERIALTLALHHKTAKAARLSETGEDDKASWLPLSAIEIEETGKTVSGFDRHGQCTSVALVKVTLPEWLAIEKGFV